MSNATLQTLDAIADQLAAYTCTEAKLHAANAIKLAHQARCYPGAYEDKIEATLVEVIMSFAEIGSGAIAGAVQNNDEDELFSFIASDEFVCGLRAVSHPATKAYDDAVQRVTDLFSLELGRARRHTADWLTNSALLFAFDGLKAIAKAALPLGDTSDNDLIRELERRGYKVSTWSVEDVRADDADEDPEDEAEMLAGIPPEKLKAAKQECLDAVWKGIEQSFCESGNDALSEAWSRKRDELLAELETA